MSIVWETSFCKLPKETKVKTIDPVTLAVIQNGLQQVCNEMDLAFVRSAFSPVVSSDRWQRRPKPSPHCNM